MTEGTGDLYLVWPRGLRPPEVSMPAGYALRTAQIGSGDRDRLRELLAAGGRHLDAVEERELFDRILPNGLFFAVDEHREPRRAGIGDAVGTCAALHDPQGDGHYFPFGGELDVLVVQEEHRRRGLGHALAAACVRRFRDAGYRSIRAGVDLDTLPAAHLFLNLGFRPFAADETTVGRWRRVYDRLGLVFDREQCVDAQSYHTRSR